MTLGAPYWDVRIAVPDTRLDMLRIGLPNVLSIDLRPPASGPEIELTIGTPAWVEEPDEEDVIRRDVERVTNSTVLAMRRRNPA